VTVNFRHAGDSYEAQPSKYLKTYLLLLTDLCNVHRIHLSLIRFCIHNISFCICYRNLLHQNFTSISYTSLSLYVLIIVACLVWGPWQYYVHCINNEIPCYVQSTCHSFSLFRRIPFYHYPLFLLTSRHFLKCFSVKALKLFRLYSDVQKQLVMTFSM
jgi:hypothetical protein